MTEVKFLNNDTPSPDMVEWLLENVGTDNMSFDFQFRILSLHHAEDSVAYTLKYHPAGTLENYGFFYCPYIPVLTP
jgi:hypothetical protein